MLTHVEPVPIPRLESERLVLRGWTAEDVSTYARMITDREVMRHLGGGWRHELKRAAARVVAAVSDIEGRREVGKLKEHWVRHGWGEWAVETRATGELIGRIGFKHHLDFDADVSRIEIGWTLMRHAWGRGYATEGAAMALRQGFERFEMERVISIASPTNQRSLGVMRHLGLVPQGRTHWHGLDVMWMAIDRPEWECAATHQSAAAR